ncbi:fibronectin type III domain-containing protein [Streptomyces sp. Act143]|uniref:fibronectin type III domain-containing protein n=1 Tax=Streptomyces sp. Act143 TaxID=2200760 RepID=UPI0015E7F798|nr:fibronectin type III domain-containing protein [Streptomyces sp. Act143]
MAQVVAALIAATGVITAAWVGIQEVAADDGEQRPAVADQTPGRHEEEPNRGPQNSPNGHPDKSDPSDGPSKTPRLPEPPTGLVADATPTSCTVTWNAAEDTDEFAVTLDGEPVAQGPETDYTAEGLEPETTYTFSVTALNSDGDSDAATVDCTTESDTTDPSPSESLLG